MPAPASSTDRVQFGVFELDLQSAELRKQGVKVKLQEQPLKVLQVLLENPGQIVSREELRQRVWPANTFVEFDQGLYSAMTRLRDALGDSSDSPRFIETIARRGYRFVAPVKAAPVLPDSLASKDKPVPSRHDKLDIRRLITSMLAGLVGGTLLLTIVFVLNLGGIREWLRRKSTSSVQVERITDFVGVKESPAISPDSKTVAFVAPVNGRKQIWIQLLAGGSPLQLTHDDADHETPRWTPDSSSLIYFTPNPSPADAGTIWELSALGGLARKITAAMSGGDISHDGQRIAIFQLRDAGLALVTISLDGTVLREIKRFPKLYGYDLPRWSPDDRWIAYVRGWNYQFDFLIQVIAVQGGEPRDAAHGEILRGFSWLPDSVGLVDSSASGSTILYPPIFNLRITSRSGEGDRQLTFGEVSYVEPDVVAGRLAASRINIRSDIWSFPVSGSPQQNTTEALRITHQTGQAQTPSVSPDGKEFVYLSDSGGHGNLWVATTDGFKTRQITFEHDPSVVIGVPIWSPTEDRIVFILTREGRTGEWLVNSDGSNLRQLVQLGSGANWSPDGKWLYYGKEHCIEKIPVAGGVAERVRCQHNPGAESFSADGSTLYYYDQAQNAFGVEIYKATPENGASKLLARIPAYRLPFDGWLWQQVLSPDGNWLAAPLLDRGTTNLWIQPATGGAMRQLTDFGERSVLIVRRVSWSPDGKHIYAAVADVEADIVLVDGLIQR